MMLMKTKKAKWVMMMNKILKTIIVPFKLFYKGIDKLIISPVSKLVYVAIKKIKFNPSFLERFLRRPNTIIYLSLALAVVLFVFVDNKATRLIENESELIEKQPVTLIYNEEALVVEGVPKTVDILLMGRRSDLYLAKQIGDHKVTLDLSGYTEGDYKVKLEYNHNVETVKYKLDPTNIQIKISKKVSAAKILSYDIVNQEKLDPKLSIGSVKLENGEVVIKGSEETLDKVATVKALVDVNNEKLKAAGTYNLNEIGLVAYDETGKIVNNVEMVPNKISAEVIVTSNSLEVPIKVVTTGEATVGYAINEIISSVSKITLYGEQSVLEGIKFIEAEIDITGLNSNKTYSVSLIKPNGIRHMSTTTTTVEVTVQQESSIEIEVQTRSINVDERYAANVASVNDTKVIVIVKGAKTILNSVKAADISAIADLSGYGLGTHNVPITIEGPDIRLTYVPKVKTISIIISQQKK